MILQFGTDVMQKMLKFAAVGASGMAVDFTITFLCKEKIGLNKYLSNSLGFSLAVVTNFFLNYFWTFNTVHNSMVSSMELFIGIAIVGLLLNNLLIYIFTDLTVNFYLAKCISIAIVFMWNFLANYLFNFH